MEGFSCSLRTGVLSGRHTACDYCVNWRGDSEVHLYTIHVYYCQINYMHIVYVTIYIFIFDKSYIKMIFLSKKLTVAE